MRNLWFLFSLALALKSSTKRHQMTIFFIQNDEVFTKTKSFLLNTHFWLRFFMTTWEREVESQRKKKPQIPSLIHQFYIYITLSSDTTTYLGLLRHRGYCFYIEVFCWFGLGNPQFLPCLLPFRERLYPSKYFELVLCTITGSKILWVGPTILY